MRFPFFLSALAAVVALAPRAAGADEPVESGSVFRFTGNGTVRFDDNVLFKSTEKESDTVFLLTPGIDWSAGNGEVRAELGMAEQFVRYSSITALNANLADAHGSVTYDGALAQAALQAAYREIDQNNLSLRTAAGNAESVRRNLTSASAKGQWSTTPKTHVGLGIVFERSTYPRVGFSNNRMWSVPVDLYYSVTPKLDLSLGDRYVRSTFATGLNNSKNHFFSVGARGDFTGKLAGQVRLGIDRLKFDSGGTSNQFGLGASLTYVYSPKTTFDLTVSNDYRSSALGTAQKVFAVGLVGRFELTPEWSIQARTTFDSTLYLSDRLNDPVDGRRDKFLVLDLSVTYVLNSYAAFNLGWVYRKNSSNDAGVDFANNVVSLSVSGQY